MKFAKYAYVVIGILLISSIALSDVAQPQPSYPAAYITERSPTFNWSAVAGAASYEFMLMDETDSVVYFSQADIATNSFAIAGAVFDQSKVYHWRVRAFDPATGAGPWSDIESFLIFDPAIVPNLQAPAGYLTNAAPLFQWSAVPGAVYYELKVMSEDESSVILDQGGIDTNSYQQPSNMPFVPYTIYHFRVRAQLADGTKSIWSDPGSFMVYLESDVPHLLGPKVLAPIGITNFSWLPQESAVGYEFLLMNEAETLSLIYDKNVAVNGYAPAADVSLQSGVVYHWKVRAKLASGARSLWSETFSFAFFEPALVPDALMPFGLVNTSRPLLEWSQVNGAASYTVEFYDSVSKALLSSQVVSGTTLLDIGAKVKLKTETAYEWRVRTNLADGTSSAWSRALAFKVSKTPWEGLIKATRLNALYYPTQHLTFAWQPLNLASVGTIRYHLVLRTQTSATVANTIWSGDANAADGAQLTLPSDVYLAPSTTHAWVVQAFNADGNLIGESRKVTFKTPVPVPFADFAAREAAYQMELNAAFDRLLTSQKTKMDALKAAKEAALGKLADQISALSVTHEVQKATLKNSQSAQIESTKESQARQIATLEASQATSLANLLASQATKMTALKAKKGVTQGEISALESSQSAAVEKLKSDQANAMATKKASFDAAIAALLVKHDAAWNKLLASQEEQMKAYQERLNVSRASYDKQIADLVTRQAAQAKRTKDSQAKQMANFRIKLGYEHLKMK